MAFNKTTFGTPAASTSFGGFGQTQTQTNTAFGSGGTTTFGANPTQPSIFGGQPQTSTFGMQPLSTGFGAPQQQQASTGFGTSGGGLFGAPAATNTFGAPTSNLFGKPTGTTFGTPNTALGSASTAGGFAGFNTASSAPGATAFSGFGAQTVTGQPATNLFSNFGQSTQTTNALSNFNFGATNKPSLGGTATGFGGFSGFDTQATQQAQQAQSMSASDALYSSIYHVNIYGDERDTIISNFNMLLAYAGVGKGYFNANQSIDYSPQNELYKFTSIVYNVKPSTSHKDYLAYVSVNKKFDAVQREEANLVSSLSQIFGSKPNLSIVVECIFPVETDKSRVVFYVNEKTAAGPSKYVSNQEIVNYLLQPMSKQQLTGLGVYEVNVYQSIDEDTLTQYLNQPPPGINAILWKNAVQNNPDPLKFIPVPIVGFEGIKKRIKLQEEESKLQQAFLKNIATQIANLQNEFVKDNAKIAAYAENILKLNNRLLKVIVKQEITRNSGLALTPTEEMIKSNFENIYSMINYNEQNFKSKISEMLSKIKLQSNAYQSDTRETYVVDSDVLCEMRTIFNNEQKAIGSLLETYKEQVKVIDIVKKDLNRVLASAK